MVEVENSSHEVEGQVMEKPAEQQPAPASKEAVKRVYGGGGSLALSCTNRAVPL